MFDLNTKITSDQHARHKRLVEEWKDRPFDTIEEHDDFILTSHNEMIGVDEHVIWAGDCVLGIHPDKLEDVIKSFHGKKHLVMGNHDYNVVKRCGHLFESIQKRLTIEVDGVKIVIRHAPLYNVHDWFGADIHLHGHTHGKSQRGRDRMDIGVDGNVYGRKTGDTSSFYGKPYTLEEAINLARLNDV